MAASTTNLGLFDIELVFILLGVRILHYSSKSKGYLGIEAVDREVKRIEWAWGNYLRRWDRHEAFECTEDLIICSIIGNLIILDLSIRPNLGDLRRLKQTV